MGFHLKGIDGVAARHVEAIVLRAAEGEIGATFRQADVGERLAERHQAVEVLGLALELKNLAVVDVGWLGLQRSVGVRNRRARLDPQRRSAWSCRQACRRH
jgi:hypothetical protein